MRRRLFPLSVLVAGSLLAGCGTGTTDGQETAATTPAGDSPSAGSSSAGPSSSGPSSAGPSSAGPGAEPVAAPFDADTRPDVSTPAPGTEGRLTVSDIRVSRQDGFDQVVFDLGGEGAPGWDVRYVPEASSQGSGEPVEVPGQAVLQVTLTGMGYPYDTDVEEYAGAGVLTAADAAVVAGVAFDATFEGTTVAFVGTTAEAPFRVYALSDPTRVVVEIADPA